MSNSCGNCLTDLRLLQALDGELPAAEGWRVHMHLERCESCRARLERLRLVSSRVVELHQLAIPSYSTEQFATELAEKESRQRLVPAWRHWLAQPLPLRQQIGLCGAFTALILGGFFLWTTHSRPSTAVRLIAPTRPPAMTAAASKKLVIDMPSPRVRRLRRSVKRNVPQEQSRPQTPEVAREIATPFFALPFSDGALPLNEATIIRVELPRSALELAGLPVDEDRRNQRVRADLILGVDGLARAIRFVE